MKKKFSRILGVAVSLALVLALVPAGLLALGTPNVSLDDDTISASTDYTIMFYISEAVAEGEDIIIDFPSDTSIAGVDAADCTIAATSGIGSDAFSATAATSISKDSRELTITVPDVNTQDQIGVGALVQVVVDDVLNPTSPGDDYTLEVSTTNEDAVESSVYEIDVPTIPALPGIVTLYNPGDILMGMYTGSAAIQDAIDDAGEDYKITIGAGTYTEDPDTTLGTTGYDGLTFVGVGAAEDVIIKGDWYIDSYSDEVTIENVTCKGEMEIYGDGCLIEDCIFEKSSSTSSETLCKYDGSDTLGGEITDCTFDTTKGSTDDVGLYIDDDGLTVSGCSFTVDEDDWGIELYYDATVKDCDFTGSSGIGVYLEDEIGIVTGCTFDGLENAFYVYDDDDGSLIAENTIMNCTGDAIYVDGVDTEYLRIINNTIEDTDEDYYAIYVEDDADYMIVVFNSFLGNELNIYNESGYDLNATNNWWGDPDGPDADSIVEYDSDSGIITSPALGATVTAAKVALESDSLDAKADTGVKVATDATSGNEPLVMAAAAYKGNPKTDTPYPVMGSYVDIYMSDAGDADEATIRIYNDRVSESTKLLVWNELQGKWMEASDQGVSTFGGYVWCKVQDEDTLPIFEDMTGIPFVLANVPLPPPEAVVIQLTGPPAGVTDVALTNVAFTWDMVEDATFYKFVLSANADLSDPLISASLSTAAYLYTGTLSYSTPYFWMVEGMEGAEVLGESSLASFVTEAEPPPPPPEPEPEVYCCPTCGLCYNTPEELAAHWAAIHVPPPEVILYTCPTCGLSFDTPAELELHWEAIHAPPPPVPPEPVTTPGYIWAIIAVGAVLMIAVIVLIVRTRRVA